MPEYEIIANQLAGRGRATSIAESAKRCFSDAQADYRFHATTYAGQAVELARQAVLSGSRVIVALGGDGTVNEVINGMMSAGSEALPELAIIPAGSGNDFSAVNQIPSGTLAACQVALSGRSRRVDIVRMVLDGSDSSYYHNTLGIGFDALVNIETRRLRGLRGMPLYFVALLRTVFLRLVPMQITLMTDDKTIRHDTLMVVAANGRCEGGGFVLAPEALVDDGELELLYTDVVSHLRVFELIPKFMRGTHLKHKAIHLVKAKKVVVSSPDDLYMHVDGEIIERPVHHIELEVLPGAIALRS
ncbi:MAG: diacylglycerol kinase family lipid kinase [Chloroflexi bacterium]|nr:diacylglycerol kinase family lipid kinase [Chloroflexota bacterium]